MSIRRENGINDTLRAVAHNCGTEIYELDISKINPSHSVRLKCMAPLCEYYSVCKVCPPNIPGVSEFKEALQDYDRAFLVVWREKIDDIGKYRDDFAAELKLAAAVASLELAAFQNGYCQAMGLCVGGCKFCKECTPPGEPCRHPFKARPSPEGFGVDITKLAREAGIPVEWPPVEYVSFLGLLLI